MKRCEGHDSGWYLEQDEDKSDNAVSKEHLRKRVERISAKLPEDKDWAKVREYLEFTLFSDRSFRDQSVRSNTSLLRALPYKEYLQTNHWAVTAKNAKHKAGYRCSVCNRDGELHAHHRTYENVGCEKAADVICLCDECHGLLHERMTIEEKE